MLSRDQVCRFVPATTRPDLSRVLAALVVPVQGYHLWNNSIGFQSCPSNTDVVMISIERRRMDLRVLGQDSFMVSSFVKGSTWRTIDRSAMFFSIDFFPCGQFHRASLVLLAQEVDLNYYQVTRETVFEHRKVVFTCLDMLKFVDRWRRRRRLIRKVLSELPMELMYSVLSYC